MKNYIKYPLILGTISALSGLLIGGIYMLTNQVINANNEKAELAARQEIFPNASFDLVDRDFTQSEYIEELYSASIDNSVIGYIYLTDGQNDYGNIKIYVGLNNDSNGSLKDISILENTQSYASTVNSWVDSTFANPIDDVNAIDVSCGATRGAALIKDMILEAQADFQKGGF